MKLKRIVFMALLLIFVNVANASTEAVHNVTIVGMSTHNGADNTIVYLKLSDSSSAYIDSGEKLLYSVALSAFMSGKTISIWRYIDITKSIWHGWGVLGGGTAIAHKLHRIDMIK